MTERTLARAIADAAHPLEDGARRWDRLLEFVGGTTHGTHELYAARARITGLRRERRLERAIGNDYDKTFQATMEGRTGTCDSFECAIQACALGCAAGVGDVRDRA